MRQFFCKKYAYCMAAMLAGVVSFSSCSNDDELIDNGPAQSGEVVKTQFAINVPYAGGTPSTRLGQDIVQGQETPVFRGMQDIILLPFGIAMPTDGVGADDELLGNAIPLDRIGASDLQTDHGNYKVYTDVEIPVGTTNFLLYGKALDSEERDNGALIPSYNTTANMPITGSNVSGITFTPQAIYNSATQLTDLTAARAALAGALTSIASAQAGGTTWASTASAPVAIGSLGEYYNNFISLKAGSAASILAALQDLYKAMGNDRVADAPTPGGGLKAAIQSAITSAGFSWDAGSETLSFNASGALAAYDEFPSGDFGLPDGSMQLTCSAGTFGYVDPSNTGSNVLEQTAYANYVRPAALYYTVNTEIKADATAHSTDGATLGGADSYTNWDDVINNIYASAGSEVVAATRSVALVDPIQYAVAQLELKARFNNGGGAGTVNDRAGAPVPVPTDGFPFTGLLIGDQKQVDWKFNTTTAAQATSYTIYDNDLYQGGSTTADAAVVKGYEEFASIQPVYTLALETAGEQSGNAETVRFALELKNTSGTAFAGVDGIVPAGGTFYLIGQLSTDPTDASAERATKVFWQDHKTTARVSISSLASAYNCIPDLREPQLELALSVDLKWEKGLVDDVEIQ